MSQEVIDQIRALSAPDVRKIIAIAGPPAAGKSTITDSLHEAFGDDLAILPMDGFHLDNAILDARGLRARKGAPETFDAMGFLDMLKRIRKGEPVIAPKFDRELDLSRGSASPIDDERIIVVEGNYLLLDQYPWRELREYWDLSIWLNVSLETVEKRCVQRWLEHDHSYEDALKRARDNDVRNARFVLENSSTADIMISSE